MEQELLCTKVIHIRRTNLHQSLEKTEKLNKQKGYLRRISPVSTCWSSFCSYVVYRNKVHKNGPNSLEYQWTKKKLQQSYCGRQNWKCLRSKTITEHYASHSRNWVFSPQKTHVCDMKTDEMK